MTTVLYIFTTLGVVGSVAMLFASGYYLMLYNRLKIEFEDRLWDMGASPEIERMRRSVLLQIGDVVDRTGWGRRMAWRLRLADLNLTPSEFLALEVLLAIVLFAALRLLFFGASPFITVPMAIIGAYLIAEAFLASRRDHYLNELDAQMSEVALLMSNSLKAGLSVLQSFEVVAGKMERPAGVEFDRISREIGLGLDMDTAMRRMMDRLPSDELRLMLTTILIQRLAGGNLAHALSVMSLAIMARFKLKDEVRTMTAEVRFNALILLVLPIAILAIINFMMEGAVGLFLSNLIGLALFVIFIGIQALSFYLINLIGKIEV
jgi:tight adherence protein B